MVLRNHNVYGVGSVLWFGSRKPLSATLRAMTLGGNTDHPGIASPAMASA